MNVVIAVFATILVLACVLIAGADWLDRRRETAEARQWQRFTKGGE